MSYHRFVNMIRNEASMLNNYNAYTSLGQVIAYDPTNYSVIVQLYEQDSDGTPALTTGWIPLFTPWAGNGWGLFAPPNIGDIIEVHYQEGNLQNSYAGLRNFNFNSLPLAVNSGEWWLVHQTGSFIKVTNDGNISISANNAINITGATTVNINGTTGVNITDVAEVNVTAPIVTVDSPSINLGSGTLSAILNASAAAVYNSHTHNDPQGGVTGTPNQTMSSSNETSNTLAS